MDKMIGENSEKILYIIKNGNFALNVDFTLNLIKKIFFVSSPMTEKLEY
jgi:hypothetical protein